jgi:hypothetical protein
MSALKKKSSHQGRRPHHGRNRDDGTCTTLGEPHATARTITITIATTSRPGLFSASLDGETLLKSSRQPMCDAARALHRLGFPDDTLMVSFWGGSKHESMRGLVGDCRWLRVREDARTSPRIASYEPFAAARVSKRKAKVVLLKERGEQVALPNGGDDRARPRG